MEKSKLIGKIFGIALVFVLVGVAVAVALPTTGFVSNVNQEQIQSPMPEPSGSQNRCGSQERDCTVGINDTADAPRCCNPQVIKPECQTPYAIECEPPYSIRNCGDSIYEKTGVVLTADSSSWVNEDSGNGYAMVAVEAGPAFGAAKGHAWVYLGDDWKCEHSSNYEITFNLYIEGVAQVIVPYPVNPLGGAAANAKVKVVAACRQQGAAVFVGEEVLFDELTEYTGAGGITKTWNRNLTIQGTCTLTKNKNCSWDVTVELLPMAVSAAGICSALSQGEAYLHVGSVRIEDLNPICDGVDACCGVYPNCGNCNDNDGCYSYGNGCEYRNYFCSGTSCTYSYSNRHTDYHDDWVYYCSGDTVRKHRLFHDFYCDGGTCKDHTRWVDDQLVDNCNANDGWYCNGSVREYRNYYCSGTICTYAVTSSDNCDNYDGWVDTGNTRWVADPGNGCQEKEQKEQQYRDYACSGTSCTFSVTNSQWIDTGNERNRADGTVCDYGAWEADPANTCKERRLVYQCSGGSCASSQTYEYRNKADGKVCDYLEWQPDPANPRRARRIIDKCSGGSCVGSGTYDYTNMDVNGDAAVNVLEMILTAEHWEQSGSPGWIAEDVNKDGAINVLDMVMIGQYWTG